MKILATIENSTFKDISWFQDFLQISLYIKIFLKEEK